MGKFIFEKANGTKYRQIWADGQLISDDMIDTKIEKVNQK